nr:hypothetical protein [uncultured Mediterranean phage uvMED]
MKNYPYLIQQKLLEAICEKLEIDHAAIVEPIRAEWKEAFTKDKAEREAETARRLAEMDRRNTEREAANKKELAEFKKRQAERKAHIQKLFEVPEIKLCSEDERPRLEAKLRNLHAEQEAAWHAYDSEEDPIESAKLKLAWSHLYREIEQLKQRLGLVETR